MRSVASSFGVPFAVLLPVFLAMSFAATRIAFGADWTSFRGSAGDGVALDKMAPTKWSASENVAWKVKLPQPGNSSPIVASGKVFLTCAEDADGLGRSLYCFDRKSGKQLWVRTVNYGEKMPTHETNLYCGSTPTSDGERVVAFHGSAGLFCYDSEGKELWSKQLGEVRHEWGYGASPIVHDGKVILHFCPGPTEFLAAFEISSGKELWRTNEPLGGADGPRSDKVYEGAWSTPIVADVGNGPGKQRQIICSTNTRVNGYDPASGKLLWWCRGLRGERGDLSYSSPVVSGDICICTGGFQGPAIGFRLTEGMMGDVTESHRLWRAEKNPQSIGTGIFLGKHLYRPNAGPGTIECLDGETGEVLWTERAGGGNHWGSIVQVGDLLYATNQEGQTNIFKPDPKQYVEIAVNKVGEHVNSTLAVSDGQIFLRTFDSLYCFGK